MATKECHDDITKKYQKQVNAIKI